jgi:hypothetical protein
LFSATVISTPAGISTGNLPIRDISHLLKLSEKTASFLFSVV